MLENVVAKQLSRSTIKGQLKGIMNCTIKVANITAQIQSEHLKCVIRLYGYYCDRFYEHNT